ncbi:unnamed protein product [Camellia sinensis]
MFPSIQISGLSLSCKTEQRSATILTYSGILRNCLITGPIPDYIESKQEFNGNYSVQVYTVQACIPKYPAALWNAEFVQAEELLRQPSTIDNCLSL